MSALIPTSNLSRQTLDFVSQVFDPSDIVLVRPIELWIERDQKRSRTLHRATRHFTAGRINEAQLAMLHDGAAREYANLFFGVCPRVGRGGFDLAWQIRTVRLLWSDVDNCTPEEALDRCRRAGLPEPSIVISSGNGVHLYWVLAEPLRIDDVGAPPQIHQEWIELKGRKRAVDYFVDPQGERVYLQHSSTGKPIPANRPAMSPKAVLVQDVLKGIAAKIGGDHTTDLSRLLRLPGTWNRKDERNGREPTFCEIVEQSNARYAFSDFIPLAEASADKQRREKIALVRLPETKKLTRARQDKLNTHINRCAAAMPGNRSEADFALCCHAVAKGVDPAELWPQIASIGKFAERGEGYFQRTWEKAQGQVRERRFEVAAREAGNRTLSDPSSTLDSSLPEVDPKPEVSLPGGEVSISETAERLGGLMSATGRYFRRGSAVLKLAQDDHGEPVLQAVIPAALPTAFESVARLVRVQESQDGTITLPAVCTEANARVILHSDIFMNALPPLRLLSRCPVLIERNGQLHVIVGYDPESGILAFGEAPQTMSVDEAVRHLSELVAEFNFASPSDRSRALAALITPALIHGRLLDARAPVDLGEADQSQSGKGFRNKLTAAVYRHKVATVTQRKGGVGSLEESFNSKLVRGALFVSLDNVRGKLDSPAIESFQTEEIYAARVPHCGDVDIDPVRIILMFTSNRAEITEDLANRASCVRILKQPPGYRFARFPEGNLLKHVQANQSLYLGAVFAVVREWHRRGKPRSAEARHDFGDWAECLDRIVQSILGEAPLLDGHDDARSRMTNPTLNWLRDVALAVINTGRTQEWLRASDLLEVLVDSEIEIPGIKDGTHLDNEDERSSVLCCLGQKLGRPFKRGSDVVVVDGLTIERLEDTDGQGRSRKRYRFLPRFPVSPRVEPRVKPAVSRVPRVGSELSVGHKKTQDETMWRNAVEEVGCDTGNTGNRENNTGSDAGNAGLDEEEIVEWTL